MTSYTKTYMVPASHARLGLHELATLVYLLPPARTDLEAAHTQAHTGTVSPFSSLLPAGRAHKVPM